MNESPATQADPPGGDGLCATLKLDLPDAEDEALGTRISHYKLMERVGEGGCGVVYVAEQTEPMHRRVALKVIKLGMDTKAVVARFEAERQALAMMDHPNIAKVLDGGSTETGRPYFVMELVRGIRITDYCDQNHLPTTERLDLFIQVCHAIQHAHQKGIIHRDIKPSNILVTLHDGVPVPKVIDFGIAKATEGRLTDATVYTQLNQFIGTPAYMSPEQAEMSGLDIDTRSDIYSLGALLYELLAGSTPFDTKDLMSQDIDVMRKMIREKEPPPPSTRLATLKGENLTSTVKRRAAEAPKLIHLLRGDLDWIVMKCLEKDRTRRYETANALAADLTRHLNHEPVLARPPSTLYRLRKSVRRNRLAYGAATAVALALALGIAFSSWQAVRAIRAEKLAGQRLVESENARTAAEASEARAVTAEREATAKAAAERVARERSEAIAKFMTGVFRSPDPARDGRTITVAETLDAAVKNLDRDLGDQPALRAQLQSTLGQTYFALGLIRDAIPLLEKARDYCLTNAGPEHPDTLAAMDKLALAYRADERIAEADELWRQILSVRRRVLGPEHPDTLEPMLRLANGNVSGKEALELREEVLRVRRKVLGPEHPDTLLAMNYVAFSFFDFKRFDEALKLRQEVLQLSRKVNGPEHPVTLMMMENLAVSYAAARRWDETIKLREGLLQLSRKVLGPEHPDTLTAMQGLANAYTAVGRHDEALALLEQVLELRRKVFGPEHYYTLKMMSNLADAYAAAGRQGEALKLREEALRLSRKALGPEHPDTAWAMHDLADSYSQAGRGEEALKLREEALILLRKEFGPGHFATLRVMNELASAYFTAGRRDEALALLASESARNPANPLVTLKLAALQVWFGKEVDHTATSRRMLLWAADQPGPEPAGLAAKVTTLGPLADPQLMQAALALARRTVELGQTNSGLPWYQLGLGMAEYRNGHYPEADQMLSAAQRSPDIVGSTAKFYRVMSLFRQGAPTEARQLFTEAEANMKPRPGDEKNPLANGADPDDLILWLACKEARALLTPPQPPWP